MINPADFVSFKGYFTLAPTIAGENAEGATEVRRFMIPVGEAFKFLSVVEKVKSVSPSAKDKVIKISWTDSDGDDVVIDSDEELAIALYEHKVPNRMSVCKLRIVAREPSDQASTDDQDMQVAEEDVYDPRAIHPGITCDGCEDSVRGYRYKCLVCPDYDLCARCEGEEIHSQHNMVRMASAQGTWSFLLIRQRVRAARRIPQTKT
eukprot:TRINITY_DN15492_c0_g1_i2.p1 TRINITY_DN15492_c0_g1~~TRINITY_DN15492_c0_g1_i2.p1  ORF type:complete len:206 (-),score=23.36 TRINITY_DN15492_c0_g1_i2:71-688(-)